MRPYEYPSFAVAIQQAEHWLAYRSRVVHSDHWQGSDIRNKPEMATHEVKHCSFQIDMDSYGLSLDPYRNDIGPNLPWADDHFDERVSGCPMNPGEQWKKWPYGHSAAQFLDERGKFNHNYMERYFPKLAGLPQEPTFSASDWNEKFEAEQHARPDMIMPRHQGIMYGYGDLNDVVELLARDPFTRQAYLPVWFPEDTGGGSKRAPCSLGYHFLFREGRLDIDYHIRSCDFVRHFRDDIYLTVRLLLWMIGQCHSRDERWAGVTPGKFLMHIGSLHLFVNDYNQLFSR
jgi:thymidylate synthase